jgi:hypothetical protein
MFHEDGTMRKSCKSDVEKQFENEDSPVLDCPTERALLTMFLHFFSPSLTVDSNESCTSLVACMPVEIFTSQGGWASISKGSKLKTFEHMNAKTSLKCKSGKIITGHINPEIVFRRALVLASSRDHVTIDNILSHPVGPNGLP